MGLSELDVSRLIRSLEPIYGERKDRDSLVRAWRDVLDALDTKSVTEAVKRYSQSEARYFPTPGQIRSLAMDVSAERYGDRQVTPSSDWNQLQEGPCPVCGAVLQLVTDQHAERFVWAGWANPHGPWRKRTPDDGPAPKRFGIIHDHARHAVDGSAMVGQTNRRAET